VTTKLQLINILLLLNKTVPQKVGTTLTEDGHKTDYQNKHNNINQKDEGS